MSNNDMPLRIMGPNQKEGEVLGGPNSDRWKPRTGNLGGKFFGKPRLILGCITDYDDDTCKIKVKDLSFLQDSTVKMQ
jgi:hypothetical protein